MITMKRTATSMIVLATAFQVLLCAPGCEKRTAGKPQPQSPAQPQPQPQPQMKPLLDPPLKWVNFMSYDMEDWNMKARSAAAGVCHAPRMTPEKHAACIRETLPEEIRKRTVIIPLREGPSKESRQIGEITITGELYTPYKIQYKAADGTLVPFEPDNALEYSDTMAFHHTVLEQQGSWVLLPMRPFPTEVWIDAAHNSILDVGGTVYEWNGRNIVILERQKTGVRVRQEIPEDNACEEAESPTPGDQIKKFDIPWTELYDENHHLRLKQKYTIC